MVGFSEVQSSDIAAGPQIEHLIEGIHLAHEEQTILLSIQSEVFNPPLFAKVFSSICDRVVSVHYVRALNPSSIWAHIELNTFDYSLICRVISKICIIIQIAV
jgi:hypothetical protein